MDVDEFSIKKISNGYILTYLEAGTRYKVEDRYFETKKEMFDFIDQILE